jgi:putative exosortase-associated protein (TIGR04073 family)
MRIALSFLAIGAVVALTGCAGPENKFGRGLNNMTEIVRGGEMSRSIEQTALWDGPSSAATTGFARGLTRTVARTGIGVYEVVTFPFPPYGPVATPKSKLYPDPSVRTTKPNYGGLTLSEKPVYPSSYEPGLTANSFWDTDNTLGFSGGEIAPIVPGSRFRVFDP